MKKYKAVKTDVILNLINWLQVIASKDFKLEFFAMCDKTKNEVKRKFVEYVKSGLIVEV